MNARTRLREGMDMVRALRSHALLSGVARWLVVVALALGGAVLGVSVGGATDRDVGPLQTRMVVQPAWSGDTVVLIPPLGSLQIDSHDGPFRVSVEVTGIDPADARAIVADPRRLAGLEDRIAADARSALLALGVRAALAALIGASLAALLVLRRVRLTLLATAVAAGTLLAGGGWAAATFEPRALASPRYTGLLTIAPSVVGDAEDIVGDFERYRQQLAKIVTNVSQLYGAASALPVFAPDEGEDLVRVLVVSDLHLNPAGFDVMRSVATQFATDLVIDAGDLTDHGSAPEDLFADQIATMGQPYLFVRGNHDSLGTARAVEAQANGIVLRDGEVETVEGLRVIGDDDPRFTPDKATRDSVAPTVEEAGERLAARAVALAAAGDPADIAVAHDPVMGEQLDGVVPLVISGHGHRREVRTLPGGTVLFEQGSTGGAGLRGLEGEEPTPVQLSVLYLSRATGELQAWDDITVGGLGLTSVEIQRTVAPAVRDAVAKAGTRGAAPVGLGASARGPL